MKTIQRSALVMHSASAMYGLVNDVTAYPQFLPWCVGTEVLGRGDDWMEARVDVSKGGVTQSFVTRNKLEVDRFIEMRLVEGPFTALSGVWHFKPLMEDACKVVLDLTFDMDNAMLKSTVGKVLDQAANLMVDAFCKRADEVYG
ncbi:type II toxin-antitoxin system RatA family toxin [Kistimonas asteriae]|uniref:type II toxin-antitoxin system RatA family toxin n=1 Tax=Kistimonas asteriae TaxID=517724 RepID=UPI001BAB1AC6|nr:type II toxin-antitoxin system RatA family toxin [Kistimonas asteriae]